MPDNLPTGNTVDRFQTQVGTGDQDLNVFLVVNKAGVTLTVNIQITDGLEDTVNISPFNMQLAAGTAYGDEGYIIKTGYTLLLTTTGSLDYYIDLKPRN